MIYRNLSKLLLLVLILLVFSSVVFAFAGSIAVPESRLDEKSIAITASDLMPNECSSISSVITSLLVCSRTNCDGSNANELILGTASDDTIDGRGGQDCIVGGDGNDELNGGNDSDVLIGGNGDDTMDGKPKKDADICYGGPGSNTYIECDPMP